jgi:hypothetical protein
VTIDAAYVKGVSRRWRGKGSEPVHPVEGVVESERTGYYSDSAMLDLDPSIEEEYQRSLARASEMKWHPRAGCLDAFDVLRAHFLIANHFYLEGEGIGGIGPRDFGLLESAVHRQIASFGGDHHIRYRGDLVFWPHKESPVS